MENEEVKDSATDPVTAVDDSDSDSEEEKKNAPEESVFKLNEDDLNWDEDDNKKGGKKKGKRGGGGGQPQ